jgi:AraC-like DNA-binding protein
LPSSGPTCARGSRPSWASWSRPCCGLRIDDRHAIRTTKIVEFESIAEFIEEHLLDLDLSPARIAKAHFISTRHLQEIFKMHGATVTGWIRHRRLERCRRALRDPRNEGRSIAAVAAESGFTDAANFSRAFKREFGVSPRALRAY